MANQEQLSILKQGVEVWNKWRTENADVYINLIEADLHSAHFAGADLSRAYLIETNLWRANLYRTDLSQCHLSQAKLIGANLSEANLCRADLSGADLRVANLRGANLDGANLVEASLRGADLQRADLRRANLAQSNFLWASIADTVFGSSDLSAVIGLDEIHHRGPSIIATDITAQSKGKIPQAFLRGCGLSDADIEYAKLSNPDLTNEEINKVLYKIYDLRASQAIQISPLFISYSHGDGEFVDELENQLDEKGIRFWRDIHDMKAGNMEKQIDRAIRQNPTVLLVLSKNSLSSDWVEHEVRTARELEKDMGRGALCPVALDDSWKSSPWPKRVMEQIMEYNILDFSGWEDDSKFDDMFRKLIDGLELFYKG